MYKDGYKHLFKPYFHFQARSRGWIYRPVTQSPSVQYVGNDYVTSLFTDKFLRQYNTCKFISIAVNFYATQGGHSNILLIYRDTLRSNKVYLMLYEPHGAQGIQIQSDEIKEQYKIMKGEFIEFVKRVIRTVKGEVTFINAPSYQISQKTGIQMYMKDKHGFCYMITSFWLYIILRLIKGESNLDTELMLNLNYIEECVFNIVEGEIKSDEAKRPQGELKGYKSHEVLYSMIVHFSYDFLTKFYLSYFKPGGSNFSLFIKEFTVRYEAKKTNQKNFNEYIFIKNIDYIPGERNFTK